MSKKPYTGSPLDYCDTICDYGIPLDQATYYVIIIGGGWTFEIPDKEENIKIRRSTKSVLFVWKTREDAEKFCVECPSWVEPRKPDEKVEIIEITRGRFNDLARTWSHIIQNPVEKSHGNVNIAQELLSRID